MKRKEIVNISLVAAVTLMIAAMATVVKVAPVPDRVAVIDISAMQGKDCPSILKDTLGGEKGIFAVNMVPGFRKIGVAFHAGSLPAGVIERRLAENGLHGAPIKVMSVEEFRRNTGSGVEVLRSRRCNGGCGM